MKPLILPWNGISPEIDEETFVAPNATVIGDVRIGRESSIWFGCVVRGDVHAIRIGERTNIQDLTMCHVTSGKYDLVIGDDVTVGHRSILHGCHVGNRVVIGMGACILDAVEIGDESIVAAGAVVLERTRIPPRSLVVGFPAKIKGEVTDEMLARFANTPRHYWNLAREYRAGLAVPVK